MILFSIARMLGPGNQGVEMGVGPFIIIPNDICFLPSPWLWALLVRRSSQGDTRMVPLKWKVKLWASLCQWINQQRKGLLYWLGWWISSIKKRKKRGGVTIYCGWRRRKSRSGMYLLGIINGKPANHCSRTANDQNLLKWSTGRKIWVTSPGKESQLAEGFVEGKRNSEWVVKNDGLKCQLWPCDQL